MEMPKNNEKPIVRAIAAMQKSDHGIGKDNEILHRIKEDHKRLYEKATNQGAVMGRKTYESLLSYGVDVTGKYKPVIVLSRNTNFKPEADITVAHTPEEAIKEALTEAKKLNRDVYIHGGSEVYKAMLPYTDELELTIIDGAKPADSFFPEHPEFTETEIEKEVFDHEPPYSFITKRRPKK